MSIIETHGLKNSTIIWIYSEREIIQTDPEYQRKGDVWTIEKKRLLIDSIINDYDLPKIYFHEFSREKSSETGFKYAIIDGRQRLEAIWQFMNDKLTLSDDISLVNNQQVNLGGLRYSDIAKEYPKLKIRFDSFVLPIVSVGTENDDIDLIEDMFSRLNEAVPLNAAEKRNAIGGDLVIAIRKVSGHDFFNKRVKFDDARYRHREVAARMLLTEHAISEYGHLIDTKKVWLDDMAKSFKSGRKKDVDKIVKQVLMVISEMSKIFHEKDELLQAQGIMVVYYLIFRSALLGDKLLNITRYKLLKFSNNIKENRSMAEQDYVSSNFELLEFDRMTQQGTNDASNIFTRVNILSEYLGIDPLPKKIPVSKTFN